MLPRSPGARLDLRRPLGKRGSVSPTLPRLAASTNSTYRQPARPTTADTPSPLTRTIPGSRSRSCNSALARLRPAPLDSAYCRCSASSLLPAVYPRILSQNWLPNWQIGGVKIPPQWPLEVLKSKTPCGNLSTVEFKSWTSFLRIQNLQIRIYSHHGPMPPYMMCLSVRSDWLMHPFVSCWLPRHYGNIPVHAQWAV